MSMEVRKESNGLKNSMVTREELAIINQFTKRALKEDEVYTFAVRLCDNEVDRDGERFPRATLEELAELFVGKSGIFDHGEGAGGAHLPHGDRGGRGRLLAGRGALLSQGLCVYAARRRERRADRADRGRHQKGSERGVQRGKVRVLHLW